MTSFTAQICRTSVAALLFATVGCGGAPAPVEEPLDADPPLTDEPAETPDSERLSQAKSLLEGGQMEEAAKLLEAEVAENPKSAKASFFLGVAREQLGNIKGAEESYRRALAVDEKLVEAAMNLSAIYLGDPSSPDQAIGVLNAALRHAPNDIDLRRNLAFAYGLKGDIKAASEQYERLLKEKEDPEIRFGYAAMLFDSGDKKAAVPHLEQASAKLEDAAAVATIASMLGHAKAFESCVKAFDRALELTADQPEWLVRRGTCKHELGDEPAASADYEKATKVKPDYAQAYYYLGLSMLEQKKKQSAKQALQQAAKLGKGDKIGELALKKLKGL